MNAPEDFTTRTTCYCCDAPADIYGDDETTPMCGKHWLAIYAPEVSDEIR